MRYLTIKNHIFNRKLVKFNSFFVMNNIISLLLFDKIIKYFRVIIHNLSLVNAWYLFKPFHQLLKVRYRCNLIFGNLIRIYQ